MRRIALAPALVLIACGPELTSGSEGGEDPLADGRTLTQAFEPYRRAPRIDMILVIDDSPSMRQFSELWALNLGAFADVIEAEDLVADIRVAITTTSVPRPTCAGARAPGGEPMIDSCRAHLEDFVGADEQVSSAVLSRISRRSALTIAASTNPPHIEPRPRRARPRLAGRAPVD